MFILKESDGNGPPKSISDSAFSIGRFVVQTTTTTTATRASGVQAPIQCMTVIALSKYANDVVVVIVGHIRTEFFFSSSFSRFAVQLMLSIMLMCT